MRRKQVDRNSGDIRLENAVTSLRMVVPADYLLLYSQLERDYWFLGRFGGRTPSFEEFTGRLGTVCSLTI